MSRPQPRSSRRAALGWGLAVMVSGSACTSSPPVDLTPSAGRRRSSGPASPADTDTGSAPRDEIDPDTDLVARLVDELSRAHARVQANRRAHAPLRSSLRGLERLHARHADELGGLIPVSGAAVTAEQRQGQVLPRLERAEDRLQRRLVNDSIAAESGALALLLAAMAAGLAQERTRL